MSFNIESESCRKIHYWDTFSLFKKKKTQLSSRSFHTFPSHPSITHPATNVIMIITLRPNKVHHFCV